MKRTRLAIPAAILTAAMLLWFGQRPDTGPTPSSAPSAAPGKSPPSSAPQPDEADPDLSHHPMAPPAANAVAPVIEEPLVPVLMEQLGIARRMWDAAIITQGPYRFLRGDPEHFSSTPERPLTRRVRILDVPEFKYPRIRVDEIVAAAGTPDEEILHEVAMVADHLVARISDGGDGLPADAIHLSGSDLVLLPVDTGSIGRDSLAHHIETYQTQGIFAEPDFLVFPQATRAPNDPSYHQLWGMPAIGAPEAWATFTGNPEVVVGVIDTGIDRHHPDLAANIWYNPGEAGGKSGNGLDDDGNGFIDDFWGWNFYADNNDPQDRNGHGTHCAGTIGAVGNNGTGVAGVAWNVRLAAIQFLGPFGGTTSDAVRAIDYATTLGITITNNSWGGGGYSHLLKASIDRAGAAGMVFVAAAGNSKRNTDTSPAYPAAYDCPNIISVAAQQPSLALATFSNYGARSVDIAAPGQGILSTVPGGYATYNGTSMAAPHVAGAAALLRGYFPAATGREIHQVILNHAAPQPALAGKCLTGGMLSLHRGFMAVPGDPGTPSDPDHPDPPAPPIHVAASIARGSTHFLKLNANGTVLHWGNGQTTPTLVPGLGNVTQVAAGAGGRSYALLNDGTVVRWHGGLVVTPIHGLERIVEIAAGAYQLLARRDDGTVWAHGTSHIANGLGDGFTTSTTSAVRVHGISDAVALSGGFSHNLVLRADGTVLAWGYNHSGQLGDGTSQDRTTPVPVIRLSGVRSLSAGSGTLVIGNAGGFYYLGSHNLAVRNDGTVWSWGHNRFGERGHNVHDITSGPNQVVGLAGIRTVTAGEFTSYALDEQGRIHAWGWNGFGQLGLGHDHVTSRPRISELAGVVQAVAGGRSAAALLADGSVWAWGSADGGSLGNGIIPENTYRPVDPGLSGIVSIGAGYDGSAFVDRDGHTWAAGSTMNWRTFSPQSSAASTLNSPVRSSYAGVRHAPARINNTEYELMDNGTVRFAGGSTLVPNLQNITAISTRGWAGAAIRDDGTLWTWGQSTLGNAQGQLGDGTTISRADARQIAGLDQIVSVAVADHHMLAADATGRVFAWGSGSHGKLGDGTSHDRLVPIQVPGLSDIVEVAAGGSHSLALTSTGALFTWGSSSTCGQGFACTTPRLLQLPEPVTAISAGSSHSLAVIASGKVFAWGINTSCQLGNGTRSTSVTPVEVSLITNAVKVAAGRNHSIALLADGTVRLWGSNSVGQIGNGESRSERPVLVIAPGGLARSATLSFAAATELNWFATHFTEAELKDPLISGDNADPDGDGIPNLLEYALGTHPRSATHMHDHIQWSLEANDTGVGVGTFDTPPADAPRHLTCVIVRTAIRPDVRLTVEFSSDLAQWHGEADSWSENITSDPLNLRFRAVPSTTARPKLFGRIVASRVAE